ncbi:MAG: hypothetical protein O3A46_01950 [Candidatus Poribacteria bacterium]|nr:hypothetical protein [Candidatus Poribacteria bacterium]
MLFSIWTMALIAATPVVEVEEIVATCESPNNGAGPLWCYGATLIVRDGDRVYASAMETGKDVPPLCNTRWRLFGRSDDGAWELLAQPDGFRHREPCPLARIGDGRLVLSVNPSTQPVGTQYGECDPHLLAFEVGSWNANTLRPPWSGSPKYTDHSYRGFAANGDTGELLAVNIDSPSGDQYWSYRNGAGEWAGKGSVAFPIRSCYPQVAVSNGSGHIMAIGDIVEPVKEWQAFKFEKSGRQWDYVFRRLFYSYSPNMSATPFSEPLEIDNVDDTSGHIRNLGMWLGGDGAAHLLYTKQSVQSAAMRDKFFPDTPLTNSLEYVVVKDGAIIEHRTLTKGGEGESGESVGMARFHATADGELHVVYYANGRNALMRVRDGAITELPLKQAFSTFFTAAERGGSKPSNTLDLFGVTNRGDTLQYARIRL